MSDKNSKETNFFHIMHDVYDIIKHENIDVWLDAGALLKHSRGQKIYPSSDIDFGIKAEDNRQLIAIEKSLRDRGYTTSAIGELPNFFEGLTVKKCFGPDGDITIDIYVYYHNDKFYFRPNSHKPLKQNKLYVVMFIFLLKAARLNFYQSKSAMKFLGTISNLVFNFSVYLYFLVCKTTQFAIPENHFKAMDKTRIKGKVINTPRNVQKYLEWRYGPNWQKPNKNWRLTDGSMVFLGKLSSYTKLFLESPKRISMGAPRSNTSHSTTQLSIFKNKSSKNKPTSLFKFSKEEIAKLKKVRFEYKQSTNTEKFQNEL